VTGEALTKRRARLPHLIGTDTTLRLSQDLPGTAAQVLAAVRAAGLEGVIAKKGLYLPAGRTLERLGEVEVGTPTG
jgi:ATP-dependent DNA ligase